MSGAGLVVDRGEPLLERLARQSGRGLGLGRGARLLDVRRARKIREHPHDDGDREDHGARALQEHDHAIEQLDRHVPHVRQPELGQRQNERRVLAAQHGAAQQQRRPHAADDADPVQAEQHEPLQVEDADGLRRHERPDQQRVDGQAVRSTS